MLCGLSRCFGRKIFVVLHEYPQRYSFDELAWLGANRFYWEFFIMQEDRLCRIKYESGSTRIYVHDDYDCLPNLTIEKMREYKWLDQA